MEKTYIRCGTEEQAIKKLQEIIKNENNEYIKIDEAEIVPKLRLCYFVKPILNPTKEHFWYDIYYFRNIVNKKLIEKKSPSFKMG